MSEDAKGTLLSVRHLVQIVSEGLINDTATFLPEACITLRTAETRSLLLDKPKRLLALFESKLQGIKKRQAS